MAGNLTTKTDNESYLWFSYQYYTKPPNKDGSIRGVCRVKQVWIYVNFNIEIRDTSTENVIIENNFTNLFRKIMTLWVIEKEIMLALIVIKRFKTQRSVIWRIK